MTLPLLDTLQEITNSELLDMDRTHDIPIAKEIIGPISTHPVSVDLVNLDLKLMFNQKKRSSTSTSAVPMPLAIFPDHSLAFFVVLWAWRTPRGSLVCDAKITRIGFIVV